MKAQLVGLPAHVLADEDHLIQIAVHAAVSHQFAPTGLRSLLDLVVMASRSLDWNLVVQRAVGWRLASVLGHALSLAGDVFRIPALTAVAASLVSKSKLDTLRKFVDPLSLLHQRRLDLTVARYAYLLAATDRPGDRIVLIARSVWPEQEWLDKRYGRYGLRIRARHLIGALRGRF
jgi:hypothetical protein